MTRLTSRSYVLLHKWRRKILILILILMLDDGWSHSSMGLEQLLEQVLFSDARFSHSPNLTKEMRLKKGKHYFFRSLRLDVSACVPVVPFTRRCFLTICRLGGRQRRRRSGGRGSLRASVPPAGRRRAPLFHPDICREQQRW